MDEDPVLDDHSRTIIHIDIDCFYAQVEMIKNPELRTIPFAVNQKSYIVTSNYLAREHGLKKMMLVQDAKKVCPNLSFVNGEDLHDYRQMSYKVTELIQRNYSCVERLALDENFIDVTEEVNERLTSNENFEIIGNIFGDTSDQCDCGCSERLKMGTILAQELRHQIKSELQLTTCAGISHNKLLAKLVGSIHRPDQQTVIFPNSAVELMLTLDSISKITGIGGKCVEQLNSIGIFSIEDLQHCDFSKLSTSFGQERAQVLYDMSFGLDHTVVKPSGKPQSIGIEDCKPLTTYYEVENKFKELLNRILILIVEDGRIPSTMKLTVRPIDKATRTGNRKTKQCNISPSLFNADIAKLPELNINKIMTHISQLFSKLVDTNKPFHLTLLGLSFSKFSEKTVTQNTLTKFLKKSIDKPSTKVELSKCKNDKVVDSGSTLQIFSELRTESTKRKRSLSDEVNPSDSILVPEKSVIKCPPQFDEAVFEQLPLEIQEELWREFERTKDPPAPPTNPNSIRNYLVRR